VQKRLAEVAQKLKAAEQRSGDLVDEKESLHAVVVSLEEDRR